MVLGSYSGQAIGKANPEPGGLPPIERVQRSALGERLRAVYLLAVFSLLLLGAATFVLKSLHHVYYPFGGDDDEGAVWWEAAHVTNLRVLYHPIQDYPYFAVPYPPVFHLVCRMAAWLTGDFLVGGRLVCVFSILGISLLLGLLVFHASPQRIPARVRASAALLSALLCFRLDSVSNYIPEMGVDTLANLLTFLGVFLFLRYMSKTAFQYAAFALFVLAVFTKQTMVAAPLACLVVSAIISPGRAFRLLGFSVALGLGVLGYLAWVTDGEALRHLFLYNMGQPFSIPHLIGGVQENIIRMTPIAAMACLALLPYVYHGMAAKRRAFVRWLRAGVQSSPYRRAVLVLGVQLILAFLTSITYGKLGSGPHYFLQWNLACCPLVGLVFVRSLHSWRPSSRYTLGGAALFLLLFLAALTGIMGSLRRLNSVFLFRPRERQVQDLRLSTAAAALRVIEETPGPVLSENMVLLMKAHKEISIEPGIMCYLSRAGLWDQSDFVKMISSQRFGAIVMRKVDKTFWTAAMVGAIEQYYVPAEWLGDPDVEDGHYIVYRPRPNPGKP